MRCPRRTSPSLNLERNANEPLPQSARASGHPVEAFRCETDGLCRATGHSVGQVEKMARSPGQDHGQLRGGSSRASESSILSAELAAFGKVLVRRVPSPAQCHVDPG